MLTLLEKRIEYSSLLCLLAWMHALPAKSQQEISVDQFTGTAHVAIPLCTPAIKNVAIPLALNYSATGVKVNDIGLNGASANNAAVGMGWALTGVPFVSREVRGVPDDAVGVTDGNGLSTGPVRNNTIVGWLTSTPAAPVGRISAFIQPAGSLCPDPCPAGEASALAELAIVHPLDASLYLNTQPIFDTEPDIFSYSLPGHSGKFVLTRSGNPSRITARTIPFDPIDITFQPAIPGAYAPGVSGNSFTIDPGYFIIKTPEGVTYSFGENGCADITRKSMNYVMSNSGIGYPDPPKFFKKEYDYLKSPVIGSSSAIMYATVWHVTKAATTEEQITFNYQPLELDQSGTFIQTSYDVSTDRRVAGEGQNSFAWSYKGSTKVFLTGIVTPTQSISIISSPVINDGNNGDVNQGRLVDQITVYSRLTPTDRRLLTYNFSYQHIQSEGFAFIDPSDPLGNNIPWQDIHEQPITVKNQHKRHFLVAIDIVDHCADRPGYQFTYRGLSSNTSSWAFPPPGSGQRDFWGYYKWLNPQQSPNDYYPIVRVYPDLINQQTPNIQPPGAPYRLFPIAAFDNVNGSHAIKGGVDCIPHKTQADFENYTLKGTLSYIALPAGGSCTLEYEPHYFFDSIANTSQFACGGTRIKNVRLYDHLAGVETVRSYDYDDANVPGKSSGRILRMPRFAFAAPLTNPASYATPLLKWQNALCISTDDLSRDPFEARNIGYGRVTETVSGRGRTTTVYAMTGSADMYQQGNGELWHRSPIRLASHASTSSPSLTLTTDPVSLSGWWYDQYPFPGAMNLNFRRGLPLQTTQESVTATAGIVAFHPVKRTDYTYGFSQPGNTIDGVSYDILSWGKEHLVSQSSSGPVYAEDCRDCALFAYAPYRLHTEFCYRLLETQETAYDQVTGNSLGLYSRYGYNANGLLASLAKRRGNENIYRTRYKYVGDYPYTTVVVAFGPLFTTLLKRHQERRDNDVVESISEIIQPGTNRVRRVVSASYNTFTTESGNRTRPYQTWSWQAAPGVINPDTVDVITTGGANTPTAEIHVSSLLRQVASVEQVSSQLVPLSVETRSGRGRSSTHLGYRQTVPVLQIANALASEVVFSNFERIAPTPGAIPDPLDVLDKQFAFQTTGTAAGTIEAHTGRGCIALNNTTQLVEATIPATVASLLATPADKYRLSFWANPSVTTSFSVKLNGATGVTAWSSQVALDPGSVGKWQRYEVLVPVADHPNAHSLQLHLTSGLATGQTVHLDDILLLPDHASAQSTTYNPLVGKTAEIDASGHTSYYDYDPAGQLSQVRDHNKAIVSRTTQTVSGRKATEVVGQLALTGPTSTLVSGNAGLFSVAGLCTSTFSTVDWAFAPLTVLPATIPPIALPPNPPSTSSGEASLSYVFPVHVGSGSVVYTVTATVHTQQGDQTATTTVTVADELPPPLVVSICRQGLVNIEFGNGPVKPPVDGCPPGSVAGSLPTTLTRYFATVPGVYQSSAVYQWYRQEDEMNSSQNPPNLIPLPSGTVVNGYILANGQTLEVTVPASGPNDPTCCRYICKVTTNAGTASEWSRPSWYYDGNLLKPGDRTHLTAAPAK